MSRQSDKVQTERQVLQEWFDRLCECVPELPVNDNLRNNKLREDIFLRPIGQYLTDDEQAELY